MNGAADYGEPVAGYFAPVHRALTELARVDGLDPATGDYRLAPLTTRQPGDLP